METVITALGIVCVVLAGYMLITTSLTNLFWLYETINTGHDRTLRETFKLSLNKARWLLFKSSLRSQFLAFVLYPWGYLPFLERTDGAPGKPPVLFIHGLYHNAGGNLLFRRWLRRAGFPRTRAFTYISFYTDYFKILDRVSKEVDALRADYPGEQIIMVGHSLGGLLIRGYLSSPACMEDGKSKVAAAVSIGAPLRGSKLAALGIGTLAKSLLYRGPLFDTLEQRDQPPPCPVLAITTPLDNFVLPATASHADLPGWTFQDGPLISHVDMIYDARVAAMAAAFLEQHTTP